MKKLVGILLIFGIGTVYANVDVKDGTYKSNNSNILNFGTGENSETNQKEYNLFLFNSELHNVYLTAKTDNPIVENSPLLFTFPENSYSDTPPSLCEIKASFLDKETLLIEANESCSKAEKSFDGKYVFSHQATFIPEKYWGKWGECEIEPAHIAKADVSADGYYHHGVLGYKVNGDTLIVDGFNLDEGSVRRGDISYQFLPDNKVTIKTYWGNNFYKLTNCNKAAQQVATKKKIKAIPHQKVSSLTSIPSRQQSQRIIQYHSQPDNCPCSGYNICIGPRGGKYCITSGGNKRYVR